MRYTVVPPDYVLKPGGPDVFPPDRVLGPAQCVTIVHTEVGHLAQFPIDDHECIRVRAMDKLTYLQRLSDAKSDQREAKRQLILARMLTDHDSAELAFATERMRQASAVVEVLHLKLAQIANSIRPS